MNKIILDEALKAKLNGLKETVEVRDEGGRILGQFVPQAAYRKLLFAWAGTLFTDEEIERAKAEARTLPFKTLDQVLKELGRK